MKTNFKKIIPYLLTLVLFMGIGLFGVAQKANAASPDGKGTCWDPNTTPKTETNLTEEQCGLNGASEITGKKAFEWIPTGAQYPTAPLTAYDKCMQEGGDTSRCGDLSGAPSKSPKTPFEIAVEGQACIGLTQFDMGGCVVKFTYYAFFLPASFLLWLSAQFFNVLISITLYSGLFKDSGFIPEAWGVVRDISNIFFLIILLFTALQIILDIGHGGAKKTITWVIIMALLINFSMFFTKVVIDTSNVIALVFYNKMKVTTKDASQQERNYNSISTTEEKDISGSMVNSFNPTKLLSEEFFKEAGKQKHPGSDTVIQGEPSFGIMIGLIIISVAIMIFASYAFFVAGLSFLGRMIELFILIIFSPFAFMSFALPALSGFEYFGWSAWIKRLIKASFMAPIFMFFMYFIFMLIDGGVTKDLLKVNQGEQSFIGLLLLILIPALLILILLLKATEFAKKGSGAIGEKVVSYGKAVLSTGAGVGLAAATGGASLGLTSTLGAISNKVASSESLKTAANDKERGFTGWAARKMLKTADYGSKASFDVRATGLGKKFASETGINLGSSIRKGGYQGQKEKEKEKLEEESKLYKTNMSSDEVKAWSQRKQDEYDSNLAAAKKNGISEEEFKKKNGTRPESYKSADQLNHARMKEFINNFGQNGLTASLARTLLKASGKMVDKDNYQDSPEYKNWVEEKEKARKTAQTKEGVGFDNDRFERMFKGEHKEPTVDSINKEKTQKVVMAAGVATALAGVGGVGWYAGAAAAAKTAAGVAAFGVADAITKKFKEATGVKSAAEAAQGSFVSGVEKEHKKLETIEKRIEESEKALKDFVDLIEEGKKMSVQDESTGEVANFVIKNENGKDVINTDGIEKRLAQLAFQLKRDDLKLQELIKKGVSDKDPRVVALSLAGTKATIEQAKLNRLKTAPEQMRRLEKEKYNLGKDKDSLHEKGGGNKHKAKEEESHPAPKPAAHPEPEKGGGGDHGGGEKHEGGGEKHGH
jgi:hypothetical protein